MFCKFEKVEVSIDKLEKMKVNSKKPFNVLRKKMWTLTDSRKCKWTEKGEPFDVLLWESRHKHWQAREIVCKQVNIQTFWCFANLPGPKSSSSAVSSPPLRSDFNSNIFCQELYIKWERNLAMISLIYNFACIHLNLNNSP